MTICVIIESKSGFDATGFLLPILDTVKCDRNRQVSFDPARLTIV